MKKRKLLFGCMAALALLLTASCSSDPGVEGPFGNEDPSNNGVSGEEVEVNFAVAAENLVASTRSEEIPADPAKWQTISKGTKIDRLIYAVYEVNETKDDATNKTVVTYTLLEQYGKGYITNTGAEDTPPTPEPDHKGQTIVRDPFKQSKEDETKEANAYTFSLRLMRNKTYSIAFWAQSSETDAYDTSNLRQVEVKYPQEDDANGDKNNDEYRDAFCKVETFSVASSSSSTSRKITLTRPFAQINVGTTGADYKNYATEVIGGVFFTASKMTLKGVARFMDVVADKVLDQTDIDATDSPYKFDANTEATTDAYFGWAKIPAYINTEIPNDLHCVGSEDKYIEVEDGQGKYTKNEAGEYVEATDGTGKYDKNPYYSEDEEFLKIKLNTDEGNPLPYMIKYPTIDKNGKFLTETFKYLSMCYVLVPASTTNVPDDLSNLTSSVLDKVEVSFGIWKEENGTIDDNRPTNYFDLSDVPVHRNWRTNILGGLAKEKETPDPSSLFSSTMTKVILDPDFYDEYNSTSGENSYWAEYPKTTK